MFRVMHYLLKVWVNKIFKTFIQQGSIKFVQSDSKDIYYITKKRGYYL